MLPGLVGKRFDVQIVDVQKHHKRPAQKLLSFEGKHGYIALNTQVDHQMLQSGKVPVGGSQMSATNVKISPKSIRPSRQISDEDPRPLTEASSRVIVIGPDREGQATKLGCYGLTQPQIPHEYGSDTVAIRFPAPQEPIQFFNLASLCCSANIHLNDNFPATNFPSIENKQGQVNDWLSHPSLAQKRMDVKTRDGRCGYLLLEVALSGETARVPVYFGAGAGNHDDIDRSHIYPIHPTSNSVERTLVIAQDAHGGKNRLGKYAKIAEETSPGVVQVYFQGRYDGKAEFPLTSLCVAKNEECWSKTRMRFPQTQFFQSERHLTQDVAVIADWLSKPCIVGKRLDVWIDNALPFHLLIDGNEDLTTDELYAYSPSRPATCRVHRSRIQPRRPTGDERERVLVLGPNIKRQLHGVGEYAEVEDYADGVCAVRLRSRYDEVERYLVENLCVARNEEGRSLRRNIFPTTKFS
ncbi:hypothetical protein C8F01DRAFT_1165624 [Mycena amicta]|nr:hypothetical protein C8F01DRAFT_1165624 [Mycena amicta]